jgi:hypothetical protein
MPLLPFIGSCGSGWNSGSDSGWSSGCGSDSGSDSDSNNLFSKVFVFCLTLQAQITINMGNIITIIQYTATAPHIIFNNIQTTLYTSLHTSPFSH